MYQRHNLIGPETLEAKWVTVSEIPWDELAFSSVTFALNHLNEAQYPVYGQFKSV